MSDVTVIEPGVYQVIVDPAVTVVEVQAAPVFEVTVSAVGVQGVPGTDGTAGVDGAVGPAGPRGNSGGYYVHTQGVPSAIWTVTHNLGYRPGGVVVLDETGATCEGDLSYPDVNTLVLTFTAAFSGTATVS